MRTEITPRQTFDYEGFDMVMADNLPTPSVLIADKYYAADRSREEVEAHGGVPVIPMRRNREIQEPLDIVLYAWRNLVERCFNRLATRYDQTGASFIDIACIRLRLRHLST